MSTRCQVKVIQEGLDDLQDECTLYHHCDGYPEYMIPTIANAYYEKTNYEKRHPDWNQNWQKGRAGKVASLLCWTDPASFEPESGHELHGDIEYYYKLFCVNINHGSMAENPKWEIEVYTSHGITDWQDFWDNPTVEKMRVLEPRQPLEILLEKYGENKS